MDCMFEDKAVNHDSQVCGHAPCGLNSVAPTTGMCGFLLNKID